MYKYVIFIVLLGIAVVGVVVEGFILAGTPISQQAITSDKIRTSDFSQIQYRIESFYSENKKLPASLSELKFDLNLQDPQSKKNYDYEIASASAYKLCTEFSTDSKETEASRDYYTGSEKKHKKGYDCIVYDIPSYLIPTPTPKPVNCRDFDGNVEACDVHGVYSPTGDRSCGYYFCSNQCWSKGTPYSIACPSSKGPF